MGISQTVNTALEFVDSVLATVQSVFARTQADYALFARAALKDCEDILVDSRHPGADRNQHMLCWRDPATGGSFVVVADNMMSSTYRLYRSTEGGDRLPDSATLTQIASDFIAKGVYEAAVKRAEVLLALGLVRDGKTPSLNGSRAA